MNHWQSMAEQIIAPAIASSGAIREICAAPGALGDVAAFYRRNHGDSPALLIADDNTDAAAGCQVSDRLKTAGIDVRCHILPGQPRIKPTVERAEELKSIMAEHDAVPLAVGSGVISDLVKYAAFQLDRDYSCIATAASMDGYSSAGSPLSDKGFKKTIPCRPPVAILADIDVLAAAPPRMAGWGFGDLAGKVPAGADWILADALGIEAIDEVAWPLVQDNLRDWLGDPDGVARGELQAVASLFIGLTISGLAMEIYGSSRPASGADHQIAHMWEMEGLSHDGERISHGACVAIGTLTVLSLFDWINGRDFTDADVAFALANARTLAQKRAEIATRFGATEIAERSFMETAAKHAEGSALRLRLNNWVEMWPELRQRLKSQLMSREEMAALLARAGAPLQAAHIGVSPQHHRDTVFAARLIRSRYSILDVLDDLGLLERAVNDVFDERSDEGG